MIREADLVVVGAGIVGLAHALAAARLAKRVIVVERDARANGASIRNFGFVTVSGQGAGESWRRAQRTRDVWAEIAGPAGIPILHRGSLVVARRPEALAVLEEFAAGPMGAGCELLEPADALSRCDVLRADGLEGALWSPRELRIEARDALPRLARYLEREFDVRFFWQCAVRLVDPPRIELGSGEMIEADACVVCPGDDLHTLFAERIAAFGLARCKLHMMRLAPQPPGWRLPGALMSDLSLIHYPGFAACPSAPALRARLERETPATLVHGIHLIAVQSGDGSLVVGDSHHYAATPDPFAAADVEALILREVDTVLEGADLRVVERWLGTYAKADQRPVVVDAPSDAVRIVVVTSGTGMSTAFALGEDVVEGLYGRAAQGAA